MTEATADKKPTAYALIDHLLRVQDVIDELVMMKKHFRGFKLQSLKDAIDSLQDGKESLDTFRDLLND